MLGCLSRQEYKSYSNLYTLKATIHNDFFETKLHATWSHATKSHCVSLYCVITVTTRATFMCTSIGSWPVSSRLVDQTPTSISSSTVRLGMYVQWNQQRTSSKVRSDPILMLRTLLYKDNFRLVPACPLFRRSTVVPLHVIYGSTGTKPNSPVCSEVVGCRAHQEFNLYCYYNTFTHS